jgi:carbon-monoxide dehydrogenase catalytic subunit
MRVLGSSELTKFLTEDIEEVTGGKFSFEGDPIKAARLMIAHIDKKREALKLRPMMYAPVTPDITK